MISKYKQIQTYNSKQDGKTDAVFIEVSVVTTVSVWKIS